jgi:hypothetical protein
MDLLLRDTRKEKTPPQWAGLHTVCLISYISNDYRVGLALERTHRKSP